MTVAARSGSGRRRRLRACGQCDWVVALPPLRPGECADCPRCGHVLVRRHRLPVQRGLAYAIAALVALVLAVAFPFVGFELGGVGNRIVLTTAGTALIGSGDPLVALVVLLSVVVLPAVYVLGLIWLQLRLLWRQRGVWDLAVARSIEHVLPWVMADVFIVGVLVSLLKIAGMAEVTLGPAFWAYCAFTLLLLKTRQSLDADWMWFALGGEPLAPAGTRVGEDAAPQGLTGCPVCGLINRLRQGRGRCGRCGERLHARQPHSLQRTVALLIVAAVLYVPANTYPVMTSTRFGQDEPSTIIGGVLWFLYDGDVPIAVIIFTASVLVPIGKMLALAWLCLVARRRTSGERRVSARLYRIVEFIGRWSMVDVFVVAILAGLIRAGTLAAIVPGPAALAFAGMVVTSMLAAMTFDPRLLWDAAPERPSAEGA